MLRDAECSDMIELIATQWPNDIFCWGGLHKSALDEFGTVVRFGVYILKGRKLSYQNSLENHHE